MEDKSAMQLSLNMIVYVILALVFLGIAIGLIRAWVPKTIPIPDTCDYYPPTAQSPVCALKDVPITRGKIVKYTASFYNDEDADIADTVQPTITCNPDVDGNTLDLSIASTGADLPVGETEDYLLTIKAPKDAVRSTYPCILKLSSTQESISITIQ
jgi:hypothetical protein